MSQVIIYQNNEGNAAVMSLAPGYDAVELAATLPEGSHQFVMDLGSFPPVGISQMNVDFDLQTVVAKPPLRLRRTARCRQRAELLWTCAAKFPPRPHPSGHCHGCSRRFTAPFGRSMRRPLILCLPLSAPPPRPGSNLRPISPEKIPFPSATAHWKRRACSS